MNIEILSAETKTNKKRTFTFSKPIQQFMVGFSKCIIQYPNPDHHVKEITIDLTNSQKNNNEIIVEPKLILKDTANHEQSYYSKVTIVVIAVVDDGNPNICIFNGIKTGVKYDLLPDNTSVKSALNLSFVQFPESDHHVYKYSSSVVPVLEEKSFSLKGLSKICDKGSNSGKGKIFGSVLTYNETDQNIMCADFDSAKLGDSGSVCLGPAPELFQNDDYIVACFISSYCLSYNKNDDHHLLKFEVSAALNDEKLVEKDGSIFANLDLKSYLTDNGKNQFNIPHNTVSGFVVAIKKNL